MSNISLRYTVEESSWDYFTFDVIDEKEARPMCSCHSRADAGHIAALLNCADEPLKTVGV